MNVRATFVSNAESTKLMQPGMGPFHHPTEDPQAAAMRRVALCQNRLDAAPPQGLRVRGRMVGPIPLNPLGTLARSSRLARNGGNCIHQGKQLGHVVAVGAGDRGGQGNAVRIRDDVMLRAVFPAIRRVGTGFRPPKTARTLELSTTARDQSSWSAACR